MATRRQELYIIAMETDQTLRYHIWIESQCLFSVNTLGDALADVICAYFVFNIAYPKPICTLIFATFCPGAKGQSKSSNICIHIVIITFSLYYPPPPPSPLHNACILHALACLYSTIALVCVLCHTTAFNVTFSSSY